MACRGGVGCLGAVGAVERQVPWGWALAGKEGDLLLKRVRDRYREL
jgi:hypothetical protein